jgi:phospholipid/cholesterol/gamma-HCH transport system permease protein
VIQSIGEYGYFLWRLFILLPQLRKEKRNVWHQLYRTGYQSFVLVIFIGLFAGAIIAWQAAYQFKDLVPMSLLGGQAFRVIVMEMGPILTAMILSGRLGSGFCAEIASMIVTEQIDAMKTLSIDPVRFVALPRFFSLLVMMPVLTIYSNFVGIFGAFIVSLLFMDLTLSIFLDSILSFFYTKDLLIGIFKAFLFGIWVGSIACFLGFQADRNTESIGNVTIKSFVYCTMGILIIDLLLWMIFF